MSLSILSSLPALTNLILTAPLRGGSPLATVIADELVKTLAVKLEIEARFLEILSRELSNLPKVM